MPVGFAAGKRSFSNAAHIQSKLRTRLSYERLHQLLYVYYNSRVLPDEPVFSSGLLGRGEGALADVGRQETELNEEGSDDCARDDTDQDGAGQPAMQQSTTR